MAQKGSEPKHSCVGKMLLNAAGGATCYECGRSIPFDPTPLDIGAAHLLADIKGYGLRSGSKRRVDNI